MRVLFGRGQRSAVGNEAALLSNQPAMLICSPDVPAASAIAAALRPQTAAVWNDIVMHVPRTKADAAAEAFSACGAGSLIAVGGGSAIGLGKAVALATGAPLLAVPTTYAGSEMTPIWGITEGGRKTTGRDSKVLPRAVVYDPDLVDSLPPDAAAISGINALAHCAEALYAENANPLISLAAAEGIRCLTGSLPQLAENGSNASAAREQALRGAWLAGLALGSVGMALHHKLCHELGGTCGLPHAATHAVVLPHALAYNRRAAPAAMAAIAGALGIEDAAAGAFALNRAVGAPQSLAELGMERSAIDAIVKQTLAKPYANPEPLAAAGLTQLLEDAYDGNPPAAPA